MELGIISITMAVGAGLASILSPCVLPVIPIIMAGAERDNRLRPLIIVTGLSVSFMVMGAVSSLFGTLLIGKTRSIEIAGAVVLVLMGLMVMLDLSAFKRISLFSRLRVKGEGLFGGLILGMSLGVIWVPCVGPFLSSTLTMVATNGQLVPGIILLGFYSLGMSLPMLVVGYSSQLLQNKIRGVLKHELLLRYVTGGILVVFGLYTIFVGNGAF